jgi:prevent-host-death family protein
MIVSIRHFKSRLAKYVRYAQSGQTIEVTSRGKVVPRLVGVTQSGDVGVARLPADGVASWQGGKPIEAVIALRGNAKPVAAMVLEDRG